mgnify:CR=1 FL=1
MSSFGTALWLCKGVLFVVIRVQLPIPLVMHGHKRLRLIECVSVGLFAYEMLLGPLSA